MPYPYTLYYIILYAIFNIKVKVIAYILHIYIYMCRNSNGVNVCLCVFWNAFVCFVFINVCNRSDIFGNPRCRVAEA